MNLNHLPVFILLLIFTSCGESTPKAKKAAPVKKDFPEFFQKVLEAHGGLETWDKMNTLKFSGTRSEPHTQYVVDLKTRKETQTVENKYTLGNDGEKVWVTPVRDSFPGKSPRFMKGLVFYFVAIPFVLADEGVALEDLGKKEVNAREYNVIKATFGDGVGDAPEDQYILYTDPTSNLIDFITYSVTYFDKSKGTQYNALRYEWKNVNGLLFPEKYIGYKWENEALGEVRYESPFANASFSQEKMADSLFVVPEGAYVE